MPIKVNCNTNTVTFDQFCSLALAILAAQALLMFPAEMNFTFFLAFITCF